jgi:hypothetical protein
MDNPKSPQDLVEAAEVIGAGMVTKAASIESTNWYDFSTHIITLLTVNLPPVCTF